MDRPSFLVRLRSRIFHVYFRFARPMTLGVRAAVIDAENRVLLVRHSYAPGWHLPGGGVEAGETLTEALAKELMEEAMVELSGPPVLHGIFYNNRYSRRDHVAVYVVRAFKVIGERKPDFEIVETGFFPLAALPAATTQAARARLEEIAGKRPTSHTW